MTGDELDLLLDAIAEATVTVVKGKTTSAIHDLSDRLKAIEARAAVPGPAGERGQPGERGEKGIDGSHGPAGPQGERGTDGEAGPAGPAGPQGERGQDGADGVPGRDGRDGAPGPAGAKGVDGIAGKDGADGRDGKDGLGFDDLSMEHDGERAFTFRVASGERVKEYRFSVPCVIYRGVFSEGTEYERGDAVTWGGSQWIAKETATVKPDESATAAKFWQLAVKRGREGKVGPEGKRGAIGPKGDKGDR